MAMVEQQRRDGPASLSLLESVERVPCDPEAEMGVLGSVLMAPAAIEAVRESLTVGDFTDPRNAAIFEAMLSLEAKGAPADFLTVSSELRARGQFDEAGGFVYLSSLSGVVPTAVHVAHYAGIVAECATRRRLIALAGTIAGQAYDRGFHIDAVLDNARRALESDHANSATVHPNNILRCCTLLDLLDKAPERTEYLVDGLVPVGGGALLAGQPGEGKTWVALLLAICVAGGFDFLGRFPCMRGPVLILDEESGESRLGVRLRKLCSALGVDPASLAPIEVASMRGVKLTDPRWEAAISAKMAELKPILVIGDSLVRFHRGDENSSRDMASFFEVVARLRVEYGAAFVFTHHLRKKGFLNDIGERIRGNSDIRAYFDVVLGFDRIDDRLVLKPVKLRDEQDLKTLSLALEDTPEGGVKLSIAGEVDKEVEKREQARSLVRGLLADGPKTRELLIEAAKDTDISQRTLCAALSDLVGSDAVAKSRDGHKTIYSLANSATMQPYISMHSCTVEEYGGEIPEGEDLDEWAE